MFSVGNKVHLVVRLAKALTLPLLAALCAFPAAAATATGSSRAVVLAPLTLYNTGPLSFGNIISGAAGTVTISPFTGARTSTGVILAGGTLSAARFEGLTGANPSHLKIDVPTGPITIQNGTAGPTMQVTGFTLDVDKNDWVPANTAYVFHVGATLTVGPNQAGGTYTGSFPVTVVYR